MKSLPRLSIAHLPTQIEALPRLGEALGGAKLYVKRDDQTGLAFGGNKTRKLELLLADAQAQGARTLITTGAIQSNHCRQTAAAAAHFGLDCILVLVGEEPSTPSSNLLLDHLLGAELVWTTRQERDKTLQAVFQKAEREKRRPYLVPYGGSSPLGASAYAFAIAELMAQLESSPLEGHPPDWIVLASSSGGTQAGMIAGTRMQGFSGRILGISVDETADVLARRVAELAGDVAALLGARINVMPDDVLVNDAYLGGGYAVMGAAEKEAIRLFARYEGLVLDPVYTGRAAAGLIDLIRKGYFQPQERILFWHTGGTPALFTDRYRNLLLA